MNPYDFVVIESRVLREQPEIVGNNAGFDDQALPLVWFLENSP